MSARPPLDPRAEELLLDEALEGLDEAELRELQEALGEHAEFLRQEAGLAVAAVDLAHVDPQAELPAALRDRVLAVANLAAASLPAASLPAAPAQPAAKTPAAVSPAVSEPAGPARVVSLPRRPDRMRFAGWLAAAACLLVAFAVIVSRPGPTPTPRMTDARAQLLAAGRAVQMAWTTTADPSAKGVEGDVVWSTADQRGFMRFRGLPANNPSEYQYQLWIFDQNQDERYPIDGGVFDIGPDGEIVVPVTAKIRVHEPTLFAITIEKPGGVVVSSRKRLVLAAKVPTG